MSLLLGMVAVGVTRLLPFFDFNFDNVGFALLVLIASFVWFGVCCVSLRKDVGCDVSV